MKKQDKIKLRNGIDVLYDCAPINHVFAEYTVGSGSTVEPYDKRGLAHLTEHMTIVGGSRDYPTKRKLMEASAKCGFNLNAGTGYSNITYPIVVLKKELPQAVSVIGDCIFNPRFRRDTFGKEKRILLNECRRYFDNINNQLARLFNQTFFRGTPTQELVIGREDHLETMTIEDVKEYHERNFRPSNTRVDLYGDLDQDSLDKTIAILEGFPDKGDAPKKVRVGLPHLFHTETTERIIPGIRQAYGVIAFRTPKAGEELTPATVLTEMVLNGSGKSSLLDRVREKLGMAYSISANVFPGEDFGNMGITFDCGPEDLERVIQETLSIVGNLNPSQSEVENVKRILRRNNEIISSDPKALFEIFVNKNVHGFSYADSYKRKMDVDRAQIREVSKRHLVPPYQAVILKPEKRRR